MKRLSSPARYRNSQPPESDKVQHVERQRHAVGEWGTLHRVRPSDGVPCTQYDSASFLTLETTWT